MGANIEGPVSALVVDSAKLQCPVCNTTQCQLTGTMVDPNSIADATNVTFAALDITAAGTPIMGLVALCRNGHEWTPFWYLLDVAAATGAALVMVHLDAGSANTLAGLYAIPCTGTLAAAFKYDTIASHTAAAPTTITLDTGSDNTEDGNWIITNILPFGWTLAS